MKRAEGHELTPGDIIVNREQTEAGRHGWILKTRTVNFKTQGLKVVPPTPKKEWYIISDVIVGWEKSEALMVLLKYIARSILRRNGI